VWDNTSRKDFRHVIDPHGIIKENTIMCGTYTDAQALCG